MAPQKHLPTSRAVQSIRGQLPTVHSQEHGKREKVSCVEIRGPNDETHGLFGVISAAVPEPSALALLGLGLTGLGFSRRREQ
jgi:PEP-CTERM motif